MANKVVTLKNSNNDTLYPVTDSNAVNINQQKTLAQALDGVVYAEDPTAAATTMYEKQLKDQNGDNIVPALGTATVTSTNIDWSTMPGSYSTTEQKTPFTWIDGKPIYKKTFVVSIPSSGSVVSFQHGINNLSFYVKAEGVAVTTSGVTMRFLPDFYIENDNVNGMFGCAIYGGSTASSSIDIAYGSFYRGGTVYATIWYTKTTD